MTFNRNMLLAIVFSAMLQVVCCACIPATYKAGVRRVARSQLSWCVKGNRFSDSCYEQVRAFCAAKKLERTCGEEWEWP